MSLKDRINEDMKAAMRARQAERLSTVRLLLAAIKQKEIDERIALDDAGVTAVIDKMIKQRRDSIAQYDGAGRTDLADKERAELAILADYMPQALSADEVVALIRDALAETGATSARDMGKVMAWLKPKMAGRADMQAVSAQVKAALD
ncbi:MAG: GatB/YqeY domain-containing protein [Betaproteobacteria bacterium]|nr:GatB/YqeY domain-containing protein [Betaproteobacteria bacterium]